MGNLESTIKYEIQRLAKREIRPTFVPLRKDVRAMRLRVSSLSRGILSLNRMTKEVHLEEGKPKPEATTGEIKASRLTPDRIRRLKKKLGISIRELGVLTRESVGAAQKRESSCNKFLRVGIGFPILLLLIWVGSMRTI